MRDQKKLYKIGGSMKVVHNNNRKRKSGKVIQMKSNREKNDFYPTPYFATEELLKREKFTGSILEPACGDGAISKVLLNHRYKVKSSDLIKRGFGKQKDFLTDENISCDNIITNPPYKLAQEFILKAKKQSKKKIAMFLRTCFLEGQKRHEMFQDKEFGLKTVYQFSYRVSLYKYGKKTKNSGTTAYAWFVWVRGYKGDPIIKWIN